MSLFRLSLLMAALWLLAGGPASAQDKDDHAGYYYPQLSSREVYVSRATTLEKASRDMRLGFITGMTAQQLSRPYPPPYAVFAKGDDAEKMIIVALGDHGFRGLFQARAVLAQLTAVARGTELFREFQVEDLFTYFDLARLLGFRQITISDGATFAHQIELR